MERQPHVYILASKPNGTLYTGVTSDLPCRVAEHLSGKGSAFTAKYHVKRLVWFEAFADIETAIAHEKRIKRWRRDWKISMIERLNPRWEDLSGNIGPMEFSQLKQCRHPGQASIASAEPGPISTRATNGSDLR